MPSSPSASPQARRLAVLDHRGDLSAAEREALELHGWQLGVTSHLAASLELLEEAYQAALVLPLTLLPQGWEWQALRRKLSPARPIPWLLIPEAEAPTGAVTQLLREQAPLADWVRPEAIATELEARLHALCLRQAQWEAHHRQLEELTGQLATDHKTGLANDLHFRRRLDEECERANRHGNPLVLMLVDLDDFKQLNDQHSYEYGDDALRQLASCLRASVRTIDIPARIGGDEFAVILPNTTLPEGMAVAQRIRQSIHQAPLGASLEAQPLQASLGLAASDGHSKLEAQQLFLRANDALKAAKQGGKDRLAFYDALQRRSVAQP